MNTECLINMTVVIKLHFLRISKRFTYVLQHEDKYSPFLLNIQAWKRNGTKYI